jgi:hypothetical protein
MNDSTRVDGLLAANKFTSQTKHDEQQQLTTTEGFEDDVLKDALSYDDDIIMCSLLTEFAGVVVVVVAAEKTRTGGMARAVLRVAPKTVDFLRLASPSFSVAGFLDQCRPWQQR